MKKLLSIIAILTLLNACQTNNSKPAKVELITNEPVKTEAVANKAVAQPAKTEITMEEKAVEEPTETSAPYLDFMDSLTFDLDLSKKLTEGHETVTVLPTGPMSINSIPERLDKWFFEVKDSGGKVKARAIAPNLAFRGIIGAIIDIFVAVFEGAAKAAMYSPAKNYDVLVEYYKADGNVKHVLFNLRETVVR